LEDLDDVTGDECDDLMALMDALEIEPDHFVDWMNSVQA
jgi:hypothetical protein